MKQKKLLVALSILVLSLDSIAQIDGLENHKCSFQHSMTRLKTEKSERFEQIMNQREVKNNLFSKSENELIIPVVFHLLETPGEPVVSEEQLIDAIRVLNLDFNHKNSDTAQVLTQFKPIVGAMNVRFVLAKTAPDGSCFNGITRTVRTTTSEENYDQVQDVMDGNNVYRGLWSHAKYLNIFVCHSIIDEAAGYTFYPNGDATLDLENWAYNSIFMLYNYTGSIGYSNNYRSRVLTHEVGHWLNLAHIWGESDLGICGSDYVLDTPMTEGSSSCVLNRYTCDATLDNVQNYMDYSFCSKMFTRGQVERMEEALYSSLGGRIDLWQDENLVEVGISDEPIACSSSIATVSEVNCQQAPVMFSITNPAASYSTYLWSFADGIPATSTVANPSVSFTSPGTKNVELLVNNSISFQRQIVIDACLSLDNASSMFLDVYPNPVVSTLNIRSNRFIERVEIFDIYGKELLLKDVDGESTVEVSIMELNAGTYLLQVYGEGKTQTMRFIKK